MLNGKAGLAFGFTIFALILFSLCTLYGMEYLFGGNHLKACSSLLTGLAILSLCIYYMCKSKSDRNKRNGLLVEIPTIMVAVIVLLIGSIPFTMFMYVINHEADFVHSITETARKVEAIDSTYQSYVNRRTTLYEEYLRKNHYRNSDIRLRVNSLQRRLIPENLDSIRNNRQKWLKSLENVSIWNISMAKNFNYIVGAGYDWGEQYSKRSAFFYEGEDTTLFEVDKSIMKSQFIYARMSTPHSPDSFSLFVAVICILSILTTYLYIRRPRNRYSGHHR